MPFQKQKQSLINFSTAMCMTFLVPNVSGLTVSSMRGMFGTFVIVYLPEKQKTR